MAQRELLLAEDRIREQSEIMLDLLQSMGMRDICAKCGAPTFWVRPRAKGGARMYNLNGTEHWPCTGGQIIAMTEETKGVTQL